MLDELPEHGRLLGVDFGTKIIGLAMSDGGQRIASPLATIKRDKFKIYSKRIKILTDEHGIVGVVVGLPLNMNASEGPRVQSTRAFARNLGSVLEIPVCFWDERLSSAAVERILLEGDLSRKRRSEIIDKMAATYILQGALDNLGYSA
jgi:putative Holliday junction resolvase